MRVKIGGSSAMVFPDLDREDDSEASFSLSHLGCNETEGDHFINFRGSVVARIAARFEAGFGDDTGFTISPSALHATKLRRPSCLKKSSSSAASGRPERKGCSVSFSDAFQIFSVDRFNDSYFEIDYDDYNDCHDEDDESDSESVSVDCHERQSTPAHSQSPLPCPRSLPDDMFTPEEASPRESVSSFGGVLSLPKPPLHDTEAPASPMSVISLVLYGQQKLEYDASIAIQRMLRGWCQRRRYRFRWLEHQIATHQDRTREEIEKIHQQTLQRKSKLGKTMTHDIKKQRKRQVQTNTVLRESQHIIAFLKKENNHLREQIQELHGANTNLRSQNARISSANCQSDDVVTALKDHCESQQAAHERLMESIPEYRAAIELLQNALEERERYCLAEAKIKLSCRKTIAMIVDKMNERLPDDDLTEFVTNLAIVGDDQSMSCLSAGEGSSSADMDESCGRKSFSQMSRRSLVNGLSESVAALHYESDSDDEDVMRYSSGVSASALSKVAS